MTEIKCLVLDVDGVLTDGSIIYTSSGEEIKAFYAQDGLALALAKRCGMKLAIITGRTSPMVERRVKELKFDFLRMGSGNKSQALRELSEETGIPFEHMAYMGDDLNDLGPLSKVGLALAPANGVGEVKEVAHYVTKARGGSGAVREALEMILKAQGQWEQAVLSYKEEAYEIGQ